MIAMAWQEASILQTTLTWDSFLIPLPYHLSLGKRMDMADLSVTEYLH